MKWSSILRSRKPNVVNAKICRECGGCCCNLLPGACHPEDFKEPLLDSLVAAFKTGKFAIDWYEEDDFGYYIRPATKQGELLRDPSWGGVCIFLNNDKCELAPGMRPHGCRNLIPTAGDRLCKREVDPHLSDKEAAAIAWRLFHEIIFEAERLVT